MALGTGKYDLHLKRLMLKLKSPAGLLMIFDGIHGDGAALKVAMPADASPEEVARGVLAMANALRALAGELEADAARMLAEGPRAVDRARDSDSEDN